MTEVTLVDVFKKSAESVHLQTHAPQFKITRERAINTFNLAYSGAANRETRVALVQAMGDFILSIARKEAPNTMALQLFAESVELLVKNLLAQVDSSELPRDLSEKLTIAALQVANTHGGIDYVRAAQKTAERMAQSARKIVSTMPVEVPATPAVPPTVEAGTEATPVTNAAATPDPTRVIRKTAPKV